MQVKPVIAYFKGKNHEFKKYISKNKPADGFEKLLNEAMRRS